MKNRRWYRLAGWLLTLVMLLTVMPVATFAEENVEQHVESTGVRPVPELIMDEEADITNSVQFAYTDASGKAVEVGNMDPNKENRITLTVSGLDAKPGIVKETVMSVALPENIKITDKGMQEFSNDAVNAGVQDGKLFLSWKGEKQDSLEMSFDILPKEPAKNDLSGSYVLGTASKVMLSIGSFVDQNRNRLNASSFTEKDGKIWPNTDVDPIWILTHVSGDYYTIRSANTGEYLYISANAEGGYLASSLYLVNANEETAQKILVKNQGNGYYSFHNNNGAISNVGKNAFNGFATYVNSAAGSGNNEKFKLYSATALSNDATINVSGTWAITNTTGGNLLTGNLLKTGQLKAVGYIQNGDALTPTEAYNLFTFEHINRNWYTIRTQSGYLNLGPDGATISSKPQNLMVRTYWTDGGIMICTGEFDNNRYYALYNIGTKTEKGYGTTKPGNNATTHLLLKQNIVDADTIVTFSSNGGTAESVPSDIIGIPGQKITMPDLESTKDNKAFIGWADVSDIYAVNTVENHRYHKVYKPGDTYTIKYGANALYAIYNTKVNWVQFGIRADGVIQDEPNDNNPADYIGHFKPKNNNTILKEGRWVIDIDSTKPVNGYYLENTITANLNWVPSSDEIVNALKNDGGVDFDPETQYIHFYVIKSVGVGNYKIDGVIRNKANVGITYDTNAPSGIDKTKISNMPGGYQVAPGTDILIGADQGGTEIKKPALMNYFFMGWNTKQDGSGQYYNENSTVHLTNNLYLYAQWASIADNPLAIRITSDWPAGKTGYVGARIKLTAELTGFDRVNNYTLQWQYTTDPDSDEWIDVPDAHELTYTYILNEETTHYTWRCVAHDIN